MHSKRVFRVLGVSLMAALGLMALTAVGAQAAEFKILGTGVATEETVNGKAEGVGLLKVPALSIEIVCQKFSIPNTPITRILSSGVVHVTVLFEECVVWSIKPGTLELIEILPCLVLPSHHITATALGQVVLHNAETETYIKFTGEPFANVEFEAGKGCPIPLKPVIKGSAAFKVVTGNLAKGGAEVKEPLLQSSEAIQALLGAKLLYGTNEAFVSGSGTAALSGAKIGCTWGAL